MARTMAAGLIARARPPRHASAVAVGSTLLIIVATALSGARGLAAQEPDTLPRDTVYEIEPIAVRTVRPTATTGGVGAITIRLDSVLLRPAPLLEDVLREIPLVQVRTNSRGEAQLALRGAEERQVAILLDGVPLTLGWDHRTDLSIVPMTAAQNIHLVRGMSSILHGPNVLGGAVEIEMGSVPVVTAEPFQASAGIDDEGGYSVGVLSAAVFDGEPGSLAIRGGIGRRERDGLPAPAGARSLYPALTANDLRPNSDLDHSDGFFSARFAPAGRGFLSATVTGFRASRGVPPELHEEAPRLWRYPDISRLVTVLAAGIDDLDTGVGRATLDVNVGVDIGSTRIEDFALPPQPDQLSDAGAFFETHAGTEEADDRTLTVRTAGSQAFGGKTIRAAATFADISHDEVITRGIPTGSPTRVRGSYRQRLWSLAGELEWPFQLDVGGLRGGRISGGLAFDGSDTPEAGSDVVGAGPTMTEWGGRLGVSAGIGGGATLLHAAMSRRGRFPALREMYSTALGRFEPNPDLRPEILTSAEAGFTSRFDRYDLQMVGFHQRLRDAIVRGAPPAASDARYMRVNRDQIRSTGLEVLAGYTVGRITLETEMTLQSVEVVAPGSAAVRAEYEPAFAGGIGGGAPLIAGVQASAEIEFLGEQFCSTPTPGREDYQTLEASTRTDVQLSRTFRLSRSLATLERVGVQLAIDNLTDSTAYDQCGLPQPGRTLRLQVRVN